MTWRAQRRTKRTEKTVIASTPRMAMRSAIWGVTRYGSSTRGSDGRKRGKRVPMLDRSGRLSSPAWGDAEHAASERNEWIGDEEIEGESRQQHSDEERDRADRRAQHEMEDGGAEGERDRRERDGDELRVSRRARRHLAETSDEVADQREQERG